ncbi:MAG: DUF3656 domain-containing protein [Acidobacteria bacterium]|nr:DUF3656 domain-containing protein [Acidobacteriota bacterium]
MPHPPRKPEIMSPAGYWPQLQAAIEAGADSVYFGLKQFTARAKVGFELAELPEVFQTLHRRGVKGFVTFNTLVFEHELELAARALKAIANAGADAVIVQDLGVMRFVHEYAPDLEIHASTQMSITSADGALLAVRHGAKRVTLARELSLDEIRQIHERTEAELEIFVHGALCVAYSGQCLSSEAWGGRSANRGQCAQACRLPYELIVDGENKPLADARYLLSPGDLYTLPQVPEIVAAGVSALKIEGRYKDVDYVALTTRAYREAVDQAWAGRQVTVSPERALQLEQVYSRGLGPFFLTGTNHQAVVEGRAPRHRGVRMGSVVAVGEDHLVVSPSAAHRIAPLKAGDGLVFDAADWRSPQEREEGGRVYEARTLRDGRLELRFANRALDFSRIEVGDLVWRTNDPALDKLVSEFVAPSSPVRRQPVDVVVEATAGQPLRTRWTLPARPEISVELATANPLGEAERSVVTEAQLREQFGRLGPTPYELHDLQVRLTGRPFVPVSVLNQLRRDAVEQLQARQSEPPAAPPTMDLTEPGLLARLRPAVVPQKAMDGTVRLHLLVRTPEQLNAALAAQPDSITLDYLDLYGLWPSLERVKASGIAVRVASPRVLKPGEEKIGEFLLRLDCPLLIRAAGLLDALRRRAAHPITGDFSLNAANTLSAQALLDLGLARLTPAYDLNAAQVTALAKAVGAASIEAVAYQHLPVFHTEHCVFCRFLSSGTSYKDCGRPCEHHRVAVQDPNGRVHPVMADVGCRNTVFGAEAQHAAAYLDQWRKAGIGDYRLEFVHETEAQVREVTEAFRATLAGRWSSAQLVQALREIAPEGVTEGSYFVPKDYLTLPILQ